jgi:hypothetical protein
LHFIAFVAASTNPLFAVVCVSRSFAVVEEEEEEEEEDEKWPSAVIYFFVSRETETQKGGGN